MKDKLVRIIGLIAAIVVIITSVITLSNHKVIPGLAPFTLSTVMFTLVYSTKQQFKQDKISKSHWSFILIIGMIAGIANIIAGIEQILVALLKR